MTTKIATFYKFTDLTDPHAQLRAFVDRCEVDGVRGLVIFATEGFNATIAAAPNAVDAVIAWMHERYGDFEVKRSWAPENPFNRLNARVRDEIVALGVEGVDPRQQVGQYIEPQDWNDLIARDEVVLIDMRNDYEIALGSFVGAHDPKTQAFHEIVDYLRAHAELTPETPIAMFCTGGIRCEKASALFLAQGFEQVYHLKGGILNYLAQIPQAQSRWRGECFVFDHRITVDHALQPGSYTRCFNCWAILDAQERQSPAFKPGLSCPRCVDSTSPSRRQRLEQRLYQRGLAKRAAQSLEDEST